MRERVKVKFTKPSLVKQSFQDQCDINCMVEKARKTGTFENWNRKAPSYIDASKYVDYKTSLDKINEAMGYFKELKSPIRAKFSNDPFMLIQWLQNPDNKDEAIKLGLIPPPPVETPKPVENNTEIPK